jgi:hypothetical protein
MLQNQWLSTDFSEDETSPTHEFEESLNYLAGTISTYYYIYL